MKIYLSDIGQPNATKALEIPFGWNSGVNLLIVVHLIFFTLYLTMNYMGMLEHPLVDGTVADFVSFSLALPGHSKMTSQWFGNIFTYQFIHSNLFEFLLSMGVLWFFGHILGALIGQRRVIQLYLFTVILSAVIFLFSHVVFPIFSGRSTIMEGAFAGALGVMTATTVFFRSHDLRISGNFFLPVLTAYAVVLLAFIVLIFKPSMAYVLVFLGSIFIGVQYARGSGASRRVPGT